MRYEGLTATDEMMDYDGMRHSVEPWDGATYTLEEKKVSLLLSSADNLHKFLIKKTKGTPHR